jgi:hypothetical protein
MYKKFVTIRKVKSLGISLTDADTGTWIGAAILFCTRV